MVLAMFGTAVIDCYCQPFPPHSRIPYSEPMLDRYSCYSKKSNGRRQVPISVYVASHRFINCIDPYVQALASTYLQAALPGLDEATIEELSAFLKENEVHESYRKLLQALEKNTVETAVQSAESRLLKTQIADDPSEWRRGLKDVVQSIIEPDDLNWMEDEEDLDDVQFVERALADIESRFERCAFNNQSHVYSHI